MCVCTYFLTHTNRLFPYSTRTGGLLRYTGKDIKNEANAAAAAGGVGGGSDDSTGPAARMANKIVKRDSGRAFAAGERLPFVFLAGQANQQDRTCMLYVVNPFDACTSMRCLESMHTCVFCRLKHSATSCVRAQVSHMSSLNSTKPAFFFEKNVFYLPPT